MLYGHSSKLNGTGFGELLEYSRMFGNVLKQARKEVSCLSSILELNQVVLAFLS